MAGFLIPGGVANTRKLLPPCLVKAVEPTVDVEPLQVLVQPTVRPDVDFRMGNHVGCKLTKIKVVALIAILIVGRHCFPRLFSQVIIQVVRHFVFWSLHRHDPEREARFEHVI